MMKKFFLVFVIACLAFANFSTGALANNFEDQPIENAFQIIENTEDIIIAQAVHPNGDELYATLDKNTNEYTLKAIVKDEGLLKFASSDKEYEYTVDVQELSEDGIKAVFTDVNSAEKFKIEETVEFTEKVVAQGPLLGLLPVIEWGGAALLSWLAANAAAITIAGVTAYLATHVWSKYKNQPYNYYQAFISGGDVYIGSAFKDDASAFAAIKGSEKVDVWAKTESKSNEAARKGGNGNPPASLHHTTESFGKGDGYYKHWHPLRETQIDPRTGRAIYVKKDNHIFYM
ncbi:MULTISPECIES: hypothetical protein [Lysinibacillus]|nr:MULTISPECIES: hypothetical protein [Lysinibacillus]